MRTEISKSFNCGFFLSEQELRRIIQSVTEHAQKAANGRDYLIDFKLKRSDGALIQASSVDESFATENSEPRRIRGVQICAHEAPHKTSWQISVSYKDGDCDVKSPGSIALDIDGESRDWAFVAASDLEDRIKPTRIAAWEILLEKPIAMPIMLLISLSIFLAFFGLLIPKDSHMVLQKQYEQGLLKDSIQAMIELERINNDRKPGTLLFVVLLFSFLVPAACWVFPAKIFPLLRPSYNFYWGDYVVVIDRRRRLRSTIGTVVILGLIVSVIGGVIAKYLPI